MCCVTGERLLPKCCPLSRQSRRTLTHKTGPSPRATTLCQERNSRKTLENSDREDAVGHQDKRALAPVQNSGKLLIAVCSCNFHFPFRSHVAVGASEGLWW